MSKKNKKNKVSRRSGGRDPLHYPTAERRLKKKDEVGSSSSWPIRSPDPVGVVTHPLGTPWMTQRRERKGEDLDGTEEGRGVGHRFDARQGVLEHRRQRLGLVAGGVAQRSRRVAHRHALGARPLGRTGRGAARRRRGLDQGEREQSNRSSARTSSARSTNERSWLTND